MSTNQTRERSSGSVQTVMVATRMSPFASLTVLRVRRPGTRLAYSSVWNTTPRTLEAKLNRIFRSVGLSHGSRSSSLRLTTQYTSQRSARFIQTGNSALDKIAACSGMPRTSRRPVQETRSRLATGRLGGSLRHLIDTVTMLKARGVHFRSVQEHIDPATSWRQPRVPLLGRVG